MIFLNSIYQMHWFVILNLPLFDFYTFHSFSHFNQHHSFWFLNSFLRCVVPYEQCVPNQVAAFQVVNVSQQIHKPLIGDVRWRLQKGAWRSPIAPDWEVQPIHKRWVTLNIASEGQELLPPHMIRYATFNTREGITTRRCQRQGRMGVPKYAVWSKIPSLIW